jgi:calcineurin-like phosphoesterase family protein
LSKVYAISDLHLGHDKILHFSPMRGGKTTEEHDQWIISQWNSVITKRDTVWVLGDVAFSLDALKKVALLKGNKNLVRGNHDREAIHEYKYLFSNVYGLIRKNGLWLSHAPIHPQELRGSKNVHGHVHQNPILLDGKPDPRYINVCVEALNGIPVLLDSLKGK